MRNAAASSVGAQAPELTIDHSAWERVSQATGGAANPCFQCAACTAVCPWGEVRGDGVSIHRLIRAAQLGIEGEEDLLWLCTTCGACETLCPRGVDITRVVLGLRQLSWQQRTTGEGLASVLWNVLGDGNPWGAPPSRRMEWAQGLTLEPYTADHDFLYYTGCTGAYDPRSQRIAKSLVEVFARSGCSFGSLKEDEPCCGDAAWSLGDLAFLRHTAARNVERFAEAGVHKLVSTSPHCNHLFATVYPQEGAEFTALHYSELLANLLEEGRLDWARDGDPGRVRVAYHDPCYLGRKTGIFDAPRQVLAAVPGIELIEFEANREQAVCCGGGGGRMWQETRVEDRFGNARMDEAAALAVDAVVTACPHCVTCFQDAHTSTGKRAPPVFDLAEVVASGLSVGVKALLRRPERAARQDATPAEVDG